MTEADKNMNEPIFGKIKNDTRTNEMREKTPNFRFYSGPGPYI